MTNETAIHRLLLVRHRKDCTELLAEALDMAIEALSCSGKPNRSDLISRQDAIDIIDMDKMKPEIAPSLGSTAERDFKIYNHSCNKHIELIKQLPSAQEKGYIKIPETGIDDVSDGYHTFRQLYYQRMMLFATIVKQNKEKAWKSLRHEDGELCFGGGWFIVGIDTPEGSYTYHYEDNFYSMFDCKELERARHWDGHTENDVTRLLSLPSEQASEEYEKGWKDGQEALREEMWEYGRDRLD